MRAQAKQTVEQQIIKQKKDAEDAQREERFRQVAEALEERAKELDKLKKEQEAAFEVVAEQQREEKARLKEMEKANTAKEIALAKRDVELQERAEGLRIRGERLIKEEEEMIRRRDDDDFVLVD